MLHFSVLFSPLVEGVMKLPTLIQQEYLKVAEYFLWATQKDFTAWFTGEWKRWERTEHNLPLLVKSKHLKAVRYGRKLVYTLPTNRKTYKADIPHGLVSTKALLRFKLSKDGKFISERFLREVGFKKVPEWAVIWEDIILCFEYGTADNFRRTRLMKKKINQYRTSLERIGDFFNTQPIVLFVFDAPRYKVKYFADRYGRHYSFYFIDLDSFRAARRGEQLSIPYIWGGDGKNYPLTEE